MNVYAVPLLVSLAACFQLFFMGYPQGSDWAFELVRVVEYHAALSSGQVLPFWGADLYRGMGSPVFLFYAPLYAALASLLMMLGFSVSTSAIAVLVFFSMVAAVGMAALTRELLGRDTPGSDSAARLASIVFVLAPYFLANMLIRNASAEFVALCLSPYPLWGLLLIHKKRQQGFFVLAVSFSLLILAHNLTGLMMAVVLSVLTLLLFRKRRDAFFKALSGIVLALGLSCWFWLAALGLKELVRIDTMQLGKFDFHHNFTGLSEMFSYNGLFAVGWFIPLVLLLAAVDLVRGNRDIKLVGLLAVALLFVFLQTASSGFVWKNVPFMPLYQFPWRMLGPLSLVMALMSGLLFHRYLSRWRLSEWLVAGLLVINAVPLMQMYEPLSGDDQKILADGGLTPEHILQQGLPGTVLDEYLPRTANKVMGERVPAGEIVLPGSVATVVQQQDRTSITFETEADGAGELRLARWYFPGWRAVLDGKAHDLSADRFGFIKMDIPLGKHLVHLELVQPVLRQWGFLVSGISLLILIVHWIRTYQPQTKR